MEELEFIFPAKARCRGRAHAGVVSSGDLEVLIEPAAGNATKVGILTSASGYSVIWHATLERFCSRADVALVIRINDFGATPAMVLLRLQQAFDEMEPIDD